MNETVAHVHLDAVGGIAGDMFCAALLDAFPELAEAVLSDIRAVLPDGICQPRLDDVMKSSLKAKQLRLDPISTGHDATHSHHHHGDAHDHVAGHDHHPTGSFRQIVERISKSRLSGQTSSRAVAILRVIAEAEAEIHGVAADEVHFHEIADWDSLADVVAAASIANALSGATWSISDLPRGGGLVNTQHGLLPVPAPATARILRGFRWRDDGIAGERVTPTGAAIVRHLVGEQNAEASGRLLAEGTGAGTRELSGIPNVLRALAFAQTPQGTAEQIVTLSFDVDDMTGEEIGVASDRLRQCAGVLDLALGTFAGKKGRPLAVFRLLVEPGTLAQVCELCFSETSTIGVRWHVEQRKVLTRREGHLTIGQSNVRTKDVSRPDGEITRKVESDDLAAIAGLARRRRASRASDPERTR